jgi:16S rRNA (guanine527-N7)-methyltransferase
MAHKNKSNRSPLKFKNGQVLKKFGEAKSTTAVSRKAADYKIFPVEEANDRLFNVFKNHEMDFINHEERHKLAQMYFLLLNAQKTNNMTRLTDFKDIAIKHFIDSIYPLTLCKWQFPLLDVGTGPGFPGIPIQIVRPNETVLLAEGVQKRVEFLKTVRSELQLKKLGIFGRNINSFFAYPVRGVVTRAVEDVSNTLRNVSTCLQTGGRVYFLKGPQVGPEIKEALLEHKEHYRLIEDIPYVLPRTSQERRLVVFEKFKAHPLVDFDKEPWPDDD